MSLFKHEHDLLLPGVCLDNNLHQIAIPQKLLFFIFDVGTHFVTQDYSLSLEKLIN